MGFYSYMVVRCLAIPPKRRRSKSPRFFICLHPITGLNQIKQHQLQPAMKHFNFLSVFTKLCIAVFCFFIFSNSLSAQTFRYAENGYFSKSGDVWKEYKDGKGLWATYDQLREDSNFYYIESTANQVAVPKNNRVNDFYILRGENFVKVYSHISGQDYTDNSHIYTSRVNCTMCGGSKVCSVCGGSGYATFTGLFLGHEHTMPCPTCNATGVCGACRGRGYTIIDNGLLNGAGSSSSGSSSGSYNSSSSYGSGCRKCHGSGTCSTCGGKGIYFTTTYGANKWIDCPECSGSKKCSLCNGSGR